MSRCIAGFDIVERLGGGAMGEVFSARQAGLDRTIALKLLSPGMQVDEDLARRFSREARIQGALTHPQLVRVLDAGVEDGQAWIAMELIEGPTLAQLIDRGTPLEVSMIIAVLAQLAAGLEHLHANGVVHRDLKPGNVLMTQDGTCKIADFGLARSDGFTVLTRTGQVVGTLAYLAPEALGASTVGAPADVYALGVIAYELATGSLPYRARGFAAWARAIAQAVVPPPIERRPDLPPALNDLMMRLLSKGAMARPDAAAVRRELEALAGSALRAATLAPVKVPARQAAAASWRNQVLDPAGTRPRGAVLVAAVTVAALAVTIGVLGRPRAPQASSAAPSTAVAASTLSTAPVEIETLVTPAGDRARVLLRGALTSPVAAALELCEISPAGARVAAPRISPCELGPRITRDLRGLKPATCYRLQARSRDASVRARAVYFRTSDDVQSAAVVQALRDILAKRAIPPDAYFILNQVIDDAPDERLTPLMARIVPLATATGNNDISSRAMTWIGRTFDETFYDLLVQNLPEEVESRNRGGYMALATLHSPRPFDRLVQWRPVILRDTADETLAIRGESWAWALQASDPERAREYFRKLPPGPQTPAFQRMGLAAFLRYRNEPALVGSLATLTRDPERVIAVEAARGLGRIGPPAAAAIRSALADPVVRALPARTTALVYALARAGGADDARSLSPMLLDAPKQVRVALVYAIATLTGSRARSLLQNALADDSDQVRSVAAWGLGEYGNAEDVEALDQLLERDPTGRAAVALARLDARSTAPHLLSYARNAWSPNNSQPWSSIFWALGQLRHAPARDLLRVAADSTEPLIKFRATEALAALDAPGTRGRTFLVDAAFPLRTGLRLTPGQDLALHVAGRTRGARGSSGGRGPGSSISWGAVSGNALSVEWAGCAPEPWIEKQPFTSCPNEGELVLSRYVETEDLDGIGFYTVRVEVLGDH